MKTKNQTKMENAACVSSPTVPSAVPSTTRSVQFANLNTKWEMMVNAQKKSHFLSPSNLQAPPLIVLNTNAYNARIFRIKNVWSVKRDMKLIPFWVVVSKLDGQIKRIYKLNKWNISIIFIYFYHSKEKKIFLKKF